MFKRILTLVLSYKVRVSEANKLEPWTSLMLDAECATARLQLTSDSLSKNLPLVGFSKGS